MLSDDWPIRSQNNVTDSWRVNGNKSLIQVIQSCTITQTFGLLCYRNFPASDFNIRVTMFCADYIASFIHHGIIVGLWCEYSKRGAPGEKRIDPDTVSSLKSVFAGCLAGELIQLFIKVMS